MFKVGHVVSQETCDKIRATKIGKVISPETRIKISQSLKGRTAWNKGKKPSQETLTKISNSLKGRIPWNKGKTSPLGSSGFSGHKHTQEVRYAISILNKGKKRTPETCNKISLSLIGDNHPNWKGGISFEPYPVVFNRRLKNRIRERDNYTCRICGVKENKERHSIHHIDYNKDNCNDINMLTVCRSCNAKVNYNRQYWQRILSSGIFQEMEVQHE